MVKPPSAHGPVTGAHGSGADDRDVASRFCGRRRLPAPERRAQILAIAKDLFVREGIDRTTLRNIAAAAGITATAIYDHFQDKEALLAAIADGYFDTLLAYKRRAVEGITAPLEQFRAMGRAYIACGLDHPEEYRLVFMTNLMAIKRGRRLSLRTPDHEVPKGAQSFLMLQHQIERLMAEGLIAPGNAAATAEVVWAGVHGLVTLMITHANFDFAPRAELVERLLELQEWGLRGAPPPPATA